MEGEKMVKKSKVGSTGRFGARYGRKAKTKCMQNMFVLNVIDLV